MTSELETAFESYIRFLAPDLPAPVREHRFAPPRRWRFDFAWPAATGGVAVELDGGAYTQGRHTRGAGFEADCEKLNEAVVLFPYRPAMFEVQPDTPPQYEEAEIAVAKNRFGPTGMVRCAFRPVLKQFVPTQTINVNAIAEGAT